MSNIISKEFETKDIKEIERTCIETIKTSPWYADAWLALGKSLYLQGYGEQAKQALRRACLLAPRAEWIHDIQELLPAIPDGRRRTYLDKLFSVKNVSVSAALIVKNEIRCITRCLNSIVNAVDEIVIVDTGSTDGTIEYIQTFQQQYPQTKLIHFTWCDDFAAARNAAFPYITSEWVLWVDADEYLSAEEAPFIKEVAGLFDTFPEPIILTLGSANHATTASGKKFDSPSYVIGRLFPLKHPFTFYGMIHEEVMLAGRKQKPPQYFPVYIHLYHDGYDPNQVPYREKLLRNIRLLRKMSKQNPNDPKWLYYLGRDLYVYGEVEAAREVLENAEKQALLTRHGRTLAIQSLLYSIYSQQQDTYDEAEAVCNRMLEVEPSFPDAYHYLARIQSLRAVQLLQAAQKNIIQAEESFNHYRGWTEANKDIYHWKNHLLYAEILEMCGNLADAKTIYTELLSICPDEQKNYIHQNLAFIESQKQRLQKEKEPSS